MISCLGDRKRQSLLRIGRPSQLKGAGGQSQEESLGSTDRIQTKPSRRKTALFRVQLTARTVSALKKVDGVR
jgi:hypothetical protein